MTGDFPALQNANYAMNTYAGDMFNQPTITAASGSLANYLVAANMQKGGALAGLQGMQDERPKKEKIMSNEIKRRVAQVFICDPAADVPLEDSLLYKGDQKLTDATDQELFYEVNIAEVLKAHNEKRVKWLDKSASKRAGKDIFLEPVKIRDLRMIIVTIAEF